MIPAVPFVNILRRASHCGYPTVVMSNHMLMQCYNLDIDSDIALNYILYIPETDDYSDPFYDTPMILSPKDVLATFSVGKKLLDAKKKEAKAKTKDAYIEMEFQVRHGRGEITFFYHLLGEVITTTTCPVQYPLDATNKTISNCEDTFAKLIGRIKPGGACLVFDGARLGLQRIVTEYPSIYFYKVKYHGKRLEVPLYKSMFLGMKDADKFYFSIQESTIGPELYVYSYQLTKRGITEQLFGYLIAF